MAAKIEYFGEGFQVKDREWTGPDFQMVKMLELYSRGIPLGPSVPDADNELATKCAKYFGAKVMSLNEPPKPGKTKEERVY